MAATSRKRKGAKGGAGGGEKVGERVSSKLSKGGNNNNVKVKERGSWNTLALESNLLKDFGVGGVALIEELTDYDLGGEGSSVGRDASDGEGVKNSQSESNQVGKTDVQNQKKRKADKPAVVVVTSKKAKKDAEKGDSSKSAKILSAKTLPAKKPAKAKGKVIAVGNNKSAKNSGMIEDLNQPGELFDCTPGRMIMKMKPSSGGGSEGGAEDGGVEKKKRLGSKRRKQMMSKRERRKQKMRKNEADEEEGTSGDAEDVEDEKDEDEKDEDMMVDNSEQTDAAKAELKPSMQEKKERRNQERKRKLALKKKNKKLGVTPATKKGEKEGAEESEKKNTENDGEKSEASDSAAPSPDMAAWRDLFVPDPILRALGDLNFVSPTPIQTLTLPAAIRDKRDVIGAAETGSGKTLCFGIPILAHILEKRGIDGVSKEGKEDEDSEKEGEELFEEDEDGELEIEEVDDNDLEKPAIDDLMESVVTKGDDEDDTVASEGEEMDEGDDNDADAMENDDAMEDDDVEVDPESDDEKDDEEEGQDEDAEEQNVEEFEFKKDIERLDGDVPPIDESALPEAPYENPPVALVLTPTRELAIQVANHIRAVAKYCNVNVVTVVGGMAQEKQIRMLKRKPEIIIATPGRLWELMKVENHLDAISYCDMLVIDETDRMIEKGHFEELSSIIHHMNKEEKKRQALIFSATMTFVHAGPLRSIKKRVTMTVDLKLDKLIKEVGLSKKPAIVDLSRKEGTAEKVVETRLNCALEEKDLYLFYFLKQYPGRTIVFCNSINCIRRLISLFTMLQFSPLPLHAAMQQRQRLKNVDRFTARGNSLLIASDVAARGLDIPNIQHVVHYQVPRTSENYIHRSGRTARADKQGVSVLLVGPGETAMYQRICHNLNKSEHLPLFPVETKYLPGVKHRVQLAQDVESSEYRMKKEFRYLDWFENQAKEADLEFDLAENHLAAEADFDVSKKKKKKAHQEEQEKQNDGRRRKNQMERELGAMKSELKSLLSKPIFPTGFSGRYLTKEGSLNIPSLVANGGSSISVKANTPDPAVADGDDVNDDDDNDEIQALPAVVHAAPAMSAVEMAKKEITKLKKLKANNPVIVAGKDDQRTHARKKAKQKAKDERKKRNKSLRGGGEGGGAKDAEGKGTGKESLEDDGFPKATFSFE